MMIAGSGSRKSVRLSRRRKHHEATYNHETGSTFA